MNPLPTIYDMALKLIEEHKFNTLIVLGHQVNTHLSPFCELGMRVYWFGQASVMAEMEAFYSSQVSLQSANFNNAMPFIKSSYLQRALILCPETIAHIERHGTLLNGLNLYLMSTPYALISIHTQANPEKWNALTLAPLLRLGGLAVAYVANTANDTCTAVTTGKVPAPTST